METSEENETSDFGRAKGDSGLLELLGSDRSVSIDRIVLTGGYQVESIAKLIRAGHARLVILSGPWGTDFDLELTDLGRQALQKLGNPR
jgi:hypothetical protein